MIYGYGDNIFPVLTTKHISLDNFNASSDRTRAQIKVKFCLTTLEQENISSWFNNHEIADLTEIYFIVLNDQTRHLVSSITNDHHRTNLIVDIMRNDIHSLRSSGAFFSASLKDILLNKDPSQIRSVSSPGFYRNQIQSEVSIPYAPLSQPELLDTQNLHLVSFLHMRVDIAGNQNQIGGNLVYDHLCSGLQ